MHTNDHAGARDSRDIGHDSHEIQKDLLLATVRFIDSLMRKLGKNNTIKKDAPSPVISITLGDKKLNRENAPANGVTLASSLSHADLDYIEKAIATPASESAHPELDRDLTITVDGKDVLVVKDGVVSRNNLIERGAFKEQNQKNGHSPNNVQEDQSIGTDESVPRSSPSRESSQEPDVIDAEVVHDSPEEERSNGRETTSREREPGTQQEATSPVIIILTRELENRSPRSQERNQLVSFFRDIGNAPRDFISNARSTFAQTRDSLLNRLNRDRDPQRRDLRQLSVLSTAHELLDRFGQRSGERDVFEGNFYRIERKDRESLSITAKDGRGTIFAQERGVVYENFSPLDYGRFSQISKQLDNDRSRSETNYDYERE